MYHVVNKPFKCHWCDDFFPTETQVALHERIHTGIIKFECPLCDFRVNRYVTLGVHLVSLTILNVFNSKKHSSASRARFRVLSLLSALCRPRRLTLTRAGQARRLRGVRTTAS